MAKLPLDPHLMERTVVDLAAAAFKNARALHTSAQAVLDAHQWPASFSFAALALEEVGKAALCMMTLSMPPAVREEFRPDFEKAFTHHQTKAEFAHLVMAMAGDDVPASIEQLVDDVVAAARRTNAVKFRGLYVDYTDTGALLQPQDVGESDARWMVAAVTAALAEACPAEDAVAEPDVFLDFMRQWQDSVDLDALGAYVEAAPEQFLTQVRAMVRDDVSPPDLFLGPVLAEQVAAADTRAALSAGTDRLPGNS
ncbi:AbiV family abortive infection protein [Streptomyces cyaneus]|uniref:AbiV family abortive infection protein n=1 Tax=Streptomyces cyaneus TaxID=1904 RepID=UPI0013E2E06F|nr:AbiV family abortive infection protein [Streptomyces cyaneus]